MNWSCNTYECGMSHIQMSYVTCTNESCHPYECVMSHIRMSHVTLMNASRHTYEWVISHLSELRHTQTYSRVRGVGSGAHIWNDHVTPHIWMRHVTYTNESCHTYEWVMSHIRMRHVTHMNQSCHSHEWVAVLTAADFRNTWRICLFVRSRWLYGVASVSRID